MTVFVKLKTLASKRPIVDLVPLEIEENITNANKLISCIVLDNARRFNATKDGEAVTNALICFFGKASVF